MRDGFGCFPQSFSCAGFGMRSKFSQRGEFCKPDGEHSGIKGVDQKPGIASLNCPLYQICIEFIHKITRLIQGYMDYTLRQEHARREGDDRKCDKEVN